MYVIWSLGLGGAEQVVLTLAGGLDRKRFVPTIVCLNEPGPFASQAIQQGIDVVALHKRPGLDVGLLWRLTRVMKRQRPGIVHTHLWGANFWGRLAAYLAGVPVIIAHEHGMQPWRGRLHFWADRWLARRTTQILFASHHVMQEYRQRTQIAASKCRVMVNGVATGHVSDDRTILRRKQDWSPEDRVIISVGRLSPEKGYADLLQAFAMVVARVPRARLVLVGDGQERANLSALQASLRLNGQVLFAGVRQDVPAWLAAADVYVQPSRREGLPLAILEAMAAGLPVVATRVGDVEGLITDGREGHLVPAEHPSLLADKLTEVLRHLDRQQPLIDAAKRMVRGRYSDDRMIRAAESVYEEALA